MPNGEGGGYKCFDMFQTVFANYFCDHVCVPIFFFLSGFLFFQSWPDLVDKERFALKYKSRIKSLFIPYIIANALFILAFTAIDLFQGEISINVYELFKGFWAKTGNLPADPPLWFLRDLMVVVLFAPLIWLAINTLSLLLPLLFGAWYLSGYPHIALIGINERAFFFFSMGSWFAIKGIDFIDKMKTDWQLVVLYWALYIGLLSLYVFIKQDWLLRLSVIVAFPALVSLVKLIVGPERRCPHSYLVCTVFIYLYHYYIVMIIWRLLVVLLGTSEISVFISYILGVIITILGFYFTYVILNKLFPKLMSVIVGGR